MKRKILTGGLAVALIVIIALFFRQQFFVPSSFLGEEELIKEIKAVYKYSNVNEVKDIIFADERNVFVPVIFENGNYGMTTWKWNLKKWELQSLDSHGSPQLWSLGDAAERYFIWNMPPDEQIAGVNFYLIRDRDAFISQYIPVYLPRIQMEYHVPFDGKGHGALKLPNEWIELLERMSEIEAGRTDQLFSSMPMQHDLVRYGWRTVDETGKLKMIEWDVMNGYGFSNGSSIDGVFPLYEGDLELGK